MDLDYRRYDHARDRDSVARIWRECGWIEDGDEKAVEIFCAASDGLVGLIRGTAECHVTTMPGTVRHLDSELPLIALTTVTTGRIARKQGLAGRLAAEIIARGVDNGGLVAGLGMFEQGFYNRLGFGTASYEHSISFDPATLTVTGRPAVPFGLTKDHWEAMHANRLRRVACHGACSITTSSATRVDIELTKDGFGLGYFDEADGRLTHHFFGRAKGETGPYSIYWLAYENHGQLLELLRVIKSLGDQVRTVRMEEPPGVHLQDFLSQPFRFRQLTEKGESKHEMTSEAYSQLRICDVPGCLERTSIPNCEPIRFNLELVDPIESLLGDRTGFRGVGGEYTVQLGEESYAQAGQESGLPLLTASVGAFTRLWMGVLPATGLALTEELNAPEDLLIRLDRNLRLPTPHFDWMY